MNNVELNPSQIGQVTELKCQAYLIENGYNVLLPIGNYLPYDLVIEKDNKFLRIQCKHATELDTGFKVYTKKEIRKDGKVSKITYKENDCDYFMTEFKDKFYIFPNFGTTETKFWTVPPQKGNITLCKLAKDFLAEDILNQL